jgi:folate-binding protein YgfZ
VTALPPPQALATVSPERFVEDYEALRHGPTVVPLGRDILRISGPDAVEYLQGQCSQDVAALEVGTSADALLLTPQGKLDALIRVTRGGEDEMYIDVDAGYAEVVAARLARFKLRVKAEIETLDWRCLSIRHPTAVEPRFVPPPSSGTSVAAAFRWGAVAGVDLFGPDPVLTEPLRSCSDEAWQSVRVETGIPVMGAELDERTIAAEADLLDRSVSFTKGCYTGQELVARLDARGNKVARRLRALVLTRAEAPQALVGTGAEVFAGDKVVGRVTSVAWSGALGAAVALGYLHRDVAPPCPVLIKAGPDGGGDIPAEARTLPLVG